MVSSAASNHSVSLASRKSMDDEYTPRVFQLWELATSPDAVGDGTSAVKAGAVSRGGSNRALQHSVVLRGFLNVSLEQVLVANVNVSFGVEGDGFYSASNYTAWTVMVGQGKPPTDGLSLMVLLVIAIGLGLPVLIIMVGTLVLSIKKCTRTKDDLLLGS